MSAFDPKRTLAGSAAFYPSSFLIIRGLTTTDDRLSLESGICDGRNLVKSQFRDRMFDLDQILPPHAQTIVVRGVGPIPVGRLAFALVEEFS
jgi:hypothetical protein